MDKLAGILFEKSVKLSDCFLIETLFIDFSMNNTSFEFLSSSGTKELKLFL